MSPNKTPFGVDERFLDAFHQLLTLPGVELRPTLDAASTMVAQAIGADKVDVFLFEADKDSLVALGTSDTPLGRLQHRLGLDRFARSNAGPLARVFETGEPYLTGHADQDPSQPLGVTQALGVRSQIDVCVEVDGQRRGVLAAVSSEPDQFTDREMRFLEAAAGWISLLIHRAQLIEDRLSEAAQLGRQAVAEELALLTRRQQEVVARVAEGLTNDEIAERLTLVPGTVANHVEAILKRLALRNRTSLATWAVEHGLYRSTWADDPD
jgi:DNA-binding CsgD family transcriptional regulator